MPDYAVRYRYTGRTPNTKIERDFASNDAADKLYRKEDIIAMGWAC